MEMSISSFPSIHQHHFIVPLPKGLYSFFISPINSEYRYAPSIPVSFSSNTMQ